MKYLLLLISLTTSIFAQEVVHSSLSAYAESKTYSNSKQKEDGMIYGVGADIHIGNAGYKLTYEEGGANTTPKVPIDLEMQKVFFKFDYKFDKHFSANINYIGVLHDNLALHADGAYVGGGGITYRFDKKLSLNFTQYFSVYDKFDIFQSDLRVDYKTRFDRVKVKFSSVTKYIYVEDGNTTHSVVDNADESYFTTAIEAHAHYKSYHLGGAAYFGKRVFAVMNDGFKLQHHAMEFDRTYAVGGGKTFGDFILRLQYIYQRATELPLSNPGVEVSTLRFMTNYKF